MRKLLDKEAFADECHRGLLAFERGRTFEREQMKLKESHIGLGSRETDT
jgi:hypothetical protein